MKNPVISVNKNSFRIRSSNDGWIAKSRAALNFAIVSIFIAALIHREFKGMCGNMQGAISGWKCSCFLAPKTRGPLKIKRLASEMFIQNEAMIHHGG